ncbi:MAG: CBS domain-containing protein [Thermoplasmatota archaeon]
MTKKIITIQKDKTIHDACMLYKEKKVGCLIIKDKEFCEGIVTERDIIERTICLSQDPKKTSISKIMTSDIKTIHALDTIEKALELMKIYNIKKLPVIQDDKVVGVITVTDISKATSDIIKRFFDTWVRTRWKD